MHESREKRSLSLLRRSLSLLRSLAVGVQNADVAPFIHYEFTSTRFTAVHSRHTNTIHSCLQDSQEDRVGVPLPNQIGSKFTRQRGKL